jgi:GTP-binding protein
MTIGINTSPLAGKVKGAKVTARQVKDRLDKELIGNVSIKVLPTERPDAWEVQGRGELALAILVEQMRREGFELTVGKPQVVTKTVDGKIHEPMEHMTIDVPEEYLGAVTQLMAARKGRMTNMANHGTGWCRMEFIVPARGLIGFRTKFLTDTRGAGIAASISEGYEPWAGPIEYRTNGSMVADRAGVVTPFAMINLQERGSFFVQAHLRGLRGHDRRRELPRRRHGRQHHQGKEAHQHACRFLRHLREPDAAARPDPRRVPRIRPRRRVC